MGGTGVPLVVQVRAGMAGDALQRLLARIVTAAADERPVLCLVTGADLAVVDALARIELLRRRAGLPWSIRATGPAQLNELLELAGLHDVLAAALLEHGLEVLGEPEPDEQ